MYFGVYKDSGAVKKDFTAETLSEAVESLVTVIEAGMDRREDITAGIYDMSKPEGKRLVVDYFTSGMGDGFTIIEKTKNISISELDSAGISYVDEGDGIIIRQWDYDA